MTLIIAFKGKAPSEVGGEALVFCSDSRETYGYLTIHPTRKIVPIVVTAGTTQVLLCTIAGSGDSAIIKNTGEIVRKILNEKCIGEWSGQRPTYEQFSDSMALIEQAVINKLAYYKGCGVDIVLTMILGGVDVNGRAYLWELDERGVAHKIDDFPGYVCIGSGFTLGGNLLLQQFLDPALVMDSNRGGLFAAYVIDQVSKVDPAVGSFDGEMDIINKNGIGFLDKKHLPSIQQEIRAREQVLRKLNMSFDAMGGANNLDRAITEGLALRAKQTETPPKGESQKPLA